MEISSDQQEREVWEAPAKHQDWKMRMFDQLILKYFRKNGVELDRQGFFSEELSEATMRLLTIEGFESEAAEKTYSGASCCSRGGASFLLQRRRQPPAPEAAPASCSRDGASFLLQRRRQLPLPG